MAKKDYTIEELQAQYDALGAELESRKKAAEEERMAKLLAEKTARYDAVVEAYDRFEKLRSEYVEDYGKFTFTKTSDDGNYRWVFTLQ